MTYRTIKDIILLYISDGLGVTLCGSSGFICYAVFRHYCLTVNARSTVQDCSDKANCSDTAVIDCLPGLRRTALNDM